MEARITGAHFTEIAIENTLSDDVIKETIARAVIRTTDQGVMLQWLDLSPMGSKEETEHVVRCIVESFFVTDVVCSVRDETIVDMFRRLGFAPSFSSSDNIVGEVYIMHKSVVLD